MLTALMHADDTDLYDLYVFNDGSLDVSVVVLNAQQLLDSWHTALKCTGKDLKLSKFYWILQDYQWHNGNCTYSS